MRNQCVTTRDPLCNPIFLDNKDLRVYHRKAKNAPGFSEFRIGLDEEAIASGGWNPNEEMSHERRQYIIGQVVANLPGFRACDKEDDGVTRIAQSSSLAVLVQEGPKVTVIWMEAPNTDVADIETIFLSRLAQKTMETIKQVLLVNGCTCYSAASSEAN